MNTVHETIDKYIQGAYESRPELLREIFTENAHMMGFLGGEFIDIPAAAYAESFEGQPAMKDQGIVYTAEILNEDVHGKIASVTIREHNYAGKCDFITSFQMVQDSDGSWRIASKLFEML